jgi:hypothetical protein
MALFFCMGGKKSTLLTISIRIVALRLPFLGTFLGDRS